MPKYMSPIKSVAAHKRRETPFKTAAEAKLHYQLWERLVGVGIHYTDYCKNTLHLYELMVKCARDDKRIAGLKPKQHQAMLDYMKYTGYMLMAIDAAMNGNFFYNEMTVSKKMRRNTGTKLIAATLCIATSYYLTYETHTL